MEIRRCIFRILCAAAMLFDLTACSTADGTAPQMPESSGYTDAGIHTDKSGHTDANSYADNSGHREDPGYTDAGSYTDSSGYIEDTGSWNHAWYVYWDADVWDEFLLLTEETEISSVSMFSCYFSEDGQLYVPQGLSELREIAEELAFSVTYLSFVNDVQHTDGSATQKDSEFLRDLWSDVRRTEETADVMLAMVRSMGADGIEIDFENIKEPELWTEYVRFLGLIWDKAQAEDLSMRVVLGVNTPVEDLDFPTGPEYSVMCYNLYGTHSGPGPKADADFLIKTVEKFVELPHVAYALATGGFEWNDDGAVTRSLTQEMAETLAEKWACEPKRDKLSGALYYTYQDDGEKFTVWYADRQTLTAWRSMVLGVSPSAEFDLWRMGGNRWQ